MLLRAFAAAVVFAVAGIGATCQTRRPDVTGSGDERIDEPVAKEGPASADAGSCTADGTGNVVLIDARSASPLSCVLVTISREQVGCGDDQPCEGVVIYRGRTDALGRASVHADPAAESLSAVAEGYVPSYRNAAPGGPAEIEMVPSDGFLLKFLDAEGNYLSRLAVTFRQGTGIIAQLRTNELADVFFASRTPFSGEPVVIEAEGYKAVTVSSSSDLGSDGHTVVLRR